MRCRASAVALLVLGAGIAAFASEAQAQTRAYYVVKCDPSHLYADEVSSAGRHSSYLRVDDCSPKTSDRKLGVYNAGAASNTAYEQYMYVAPPNTVIDGACLEHRLRRQNHHRAEITAYPNFPTLEIGGDAPAGWSPRECYDLNHTQLIVRLACNQAGGCPAGPNAHAYIRNLELKIADPHAPVLTHVSGGLSGGGWRRGVQDIGAGASDLGGGIVHVVAYVNGQEIGRTTGECTAGGLPWPWAIKLMPCPGSPRRLEAFVDTAQAPFRNGSNVVRLYGADYAGNAVAETRTVRVDNQPPILAFANTQDPEDPELIRASVSEVHSGIDKAGISYRAVNASTWVPLATRVEAGELVAWVPSDLPPGEYEFRVDAEDIAGNSSSTTLRQNGTPMRLTFPLRTATQIVFGLGRGSALSQTVRYGSPSAVRGRLLDASGRPLPSRDVRVIEHFGDGALIRERPTTLVTGPNGEFHARIPAGPSRSIEAHFAGSKKYLPARTEGIEFNVKSRISFRTSGRRVDEGKQVTFSGKVGHFGARIPSGGKLAELQVRVKTGRWDTVKEAFRTRSNGKYRLRYRFGRHYVSDALFRFRVKVQEEGHWPFKRSASRQRQIIVRAR
jgi:hypothetical protein